MRCPFSDELQSDEVNAEDPRIAAHLAACPTCREEQALRALLAALPAIEPPADLAARAAALPATAAPLTCEETLERLETYREGELTLAQTFLVEEHLLWCAACAAELERADQVRVLLAELPELSAPAAIAVRIAAARVPWWQHLLPRAPAWGLGFAAAALLVVALATGLLRQPNTDVARPAPAPLPVVDALPETNPAVSDARPAARPVAPNPVTAPATRPVAKTPPAPVIKNPPAAASAADAPAAHALAPDLAPAAAPRVRPTVLVRTLPPAVAARRVYDTPRPDPAPRAPEAAPDYTASARDDMLRVAREEELAAIEESLSSAPGEMIAAVARRRPEVAPTAAVAAAAAADSSAARAEELRKAIIEDLRRRNAPANPKPIVIRNTERDARAGVLVTIH
ncbi:MAG TPA: zf-HC2 domain-containing protein [Armatimonadota bacterium]|nr:zf-HC2 domain-containing protein [Armatimonadota bacterium]